MTMVAATPSTAMSPCVRDALAFLHELPLASGERDLRLDSRAVRAGDIFLAVPGGRSDGRQFLADAIDRGAAAALVDADGWDGAAQVIPVLPVNGLRDSLGALAAAYYERPSEQLLSIGVTGTNGKTSCSQWIAQLLTHEGRRCAVVGTVGIGFLGSLHASELTTPDPVSLQRELRHLLDAGAQALAMEVSSIGLEQRRVDGMHFDVALFTNLTRDHLDVHGTMERYEAAKAMLFEWPGLRHAVINLDDPAGCRVAARAADRGVDVIGYSAQADTTPRPLAPRLLARQIRATEEGLAFELCVGDQTHPVEVQLVGHFNVSNLLGVVGVSLACGIRSDVAAAALPTMVPPPGRMQRVDANVQPLVVVDYAHTPDALAQALEALRPLVRARQGRLWVVFGAGGDRDPGKRAPMGAAAAAADAVIITSDNPRTEDPQHIVDQVAAGARAARNLLTEVDRARAIERAIIAADPADVVLIAGKGHEDYQIVGTEKRPFSDVVQARRSLTMRARDRA
ncbi:MAG TPA: UDP-N-acetylmuramoyl-L-alanyl-D-glutamate--2,6-diaminopimelate ligase [Burkholderiaceae bacterium]|nr:UDP-N-acetylmuramoyl-L-alanyl-D-glutamate--2,6-diaminopimelate ligase [Burkholderiaceae bacterium]